MQYLFVASASITLFILTLLLGKKEKEKPDYILSSILIILLMNFSTLFILNLSEMPFPVWKELIFEFSEASIFLYGPLLWLYTKSYTEVSFRLKKQHAWHFVFFFLAFLYFLFGVFSLMAISQPVRNGLLVIKLVSILVYTVWSLRLLQAHGKKIQHIFSNTDQKKLNWLKFLCWSILAIGFIAATSLLVDRLTSLNIPQYGGILTNIALCIFVYTLGYFGFKQEFIFQISSGTSSEKLKYAKSGLKPAQSEKDYHILESYILNEKPYLEAELTLFSLAQQLDFRPNHLSQIINSLSGSNFYDFINRYRIDEAKQLINSPEVQKITLLGIGLSCGFSSKSTFNRAFKKHTGLTPSEYKKTLTA